MAVNRIPVFFTFNNDYVVPAAVAFFSLLNRAKQSVFYEMYVLHSDITMENEKLLLSIIKRFHNAELKFINTQGFLQNEWHKGNFDGNNTKNQFTSDTIIRCFAARFFPQYKKIIYSDVDVVFVDDISELWNVDLHDKYIAGVKDFAMQYNPNELSHLKPEHYEMLKDSYIAGGIWVLNLDLIRHDDLESEIMRIIADKTIIKRWNDQDIMNIACKNKVIHIPLNYISYPYMLKHLSLPEFVSHYSAQELWDSIINPKIVHYAATKPWKDKIRYDDIWWDIFYFLKLPKTKIFTDIQDKHLNKHLKYKRLFNITLVISVLSIIINILGTIL